MMATQNPETYAAIDAAILPYLPRDRIKACYAAAPGNELRRKFSSPKSSAALVANAFGLFLEQPGLLEGLPIERPSKVNLECEVRFPWAGGRHPYLDVLIEGNGALIGVESKRYEPFRARVTAEFSAAFRRPVWGDMMQGYEAIRDLLGADPLAFTHLDAAQLVKHALALRTTVKRETARHDGKRIVLVYLYAEPMAWPDGRPISVDLHARHRQEVERFAAATGGSEVDFHPITYQALLACWEASSSHVMHTHAQAIREHFKV
jgi:hypothetical protein